jgi:menaquinone-dependent protoporphyrinogen IX oxidase
MPGDKILVTYTTNAGATTEVAQVVGEEMGKGGAPVEVERLEQVASLEAYRAVIVGAPMIMGWHPAARKFIRAQQAALSQRPVAYFFTAMKLTRTSETSIDGIPVAVDPLLAKPPRQAGCMSFRERYATPANYLRSALIASPQIKPISAAFFGGKLAYYNLKLWQMLFVMLIIQAQPGGSHNWAFIREWAGGVRDEFNCR